MGSADPRVGRGGAAGSRETATLANRCPAVVLREPRAPGEKWWVPVRVPAEQSLPPRSRMG